MKKEIGLLAFALLWLATTSCGGGAKRSEGMKERVEADDKANVIGSESLDNLDRSWINIKYVDVLRQTASPKAAVDTTQYSLITIDKDTANFIFNFHEGCSFPLEPTADKGYSIGCESEWDSMDGGTLFALNDTLYLAGNEICEKFIRLESLTPNGSLAELLNEACFVGEYHQKGSDKVIRFNVDGSIMGWDDFTNYDISIDVITFPNGVDYLSLIDASGEVKRFAWKRVGDEIELFNFSSVDEYELVTDKVLKENYYTTLLPQKKGL
ncbi:MAG: hypothetical protein ACRCZY_01470 [Phocaeicola sp.]